MTPTRPSRVTARRQQGSTRCSAFEVARVGLAQFCVCTVGLLVLWVAVPVLSGRYDSVAIVSGSMSPRIRSSDVVLITPTDGHHLARGTVITFKDPAHPGRRLTHRIVKRLPDGSYRTKGDANREPDSTPVRPRTIEGVGRLVVPLVGAPIVWIHDGQAWRVALLAGALVLLVAAMRSSRIDPGREPRRAGAAVATVTIVSVLAILTTMGLRLSSARFSASTATLASTWQAGSWGVVEAAPGVAAPVTAESPAEGTQVGGTDRSEAPIE